MAKITPQILLTFISIDKKPDKTINSQLYEQLKNGIFKGMLRPSDRLPSTREMSRELKISRNTILLVFEQLTMEGFFETKTGSGTFISKNVEKFSYSKYKSVHAVQKPTHDLARPNGLNDAFKGHISALEPVLPFQKSVQ